MLIGWVTVTWCGVNNSWTFHYLATEGLRWELCMYCVWFIRPVWSRFCPKQLLCHAVIHPMQYKLSAITRVGFFKSNLPILTLGRMYVLCVRSLHATDVQWQILWQGDINDRSICETMPCYDNELKRCHSRTEQRAANGTTCGNRKVSSSELQ